MAPVQRVHELRTPGKHADRQATAQRFSIRRKVGPYLKKRLHSARVHAEPGSAFIENKRRAGILGDAPQFPQKLFWLKIGVMALHRLRQYARQFPGVLLNPLQRRRGSIFQNGDVL